MQGRRVREKKRGRKRDAWCRVETEVLPHAGAWLSQAKHRQTDTCLESSIMPDDVPQGLKVRDGVKHAWKAKQCGCNLMRNVACPVEALPCFVGIGIGLITVQQELTMSRSIHEDLVKFKEGNMRRKRVRWN
ncbi:hypothetical protein CTAM01_06533 [Colletotrichum tamarilloi]|uniref:Uncharacterized protein n=1 Tax=Colletotrichum tamarilloi TaxID=1209934 RepID=A0ABQ9RBK7_9PEZI|nr:uncharacterized protein CTAM01_06533 [Colletotrichum tamarilloi]KAK1500598.1 hypothetical protein CTAM01_06533 [Colletotrichum tamarilloi]